MMQLSGMSRIIPIMQISNFCESDCAWNEKGELESKEKRLVALSTFYFILIMSILHQLSYESVWCCTSESNLQSKLCSSPMSSFGIVTVEKQDLKDQGEGGGRRSKFKFIDKIITFTERNIAER